MKILSTAGWNDFELLDSGEGYRLERFGKYILSRPDPQIIWKKKLPENEWQKADAVFQRTTEDKGHWVKKNPQMPEKWLMQYKNLSFWCKLTPFKHTGVFPEQHVQWDWITEQIKLRLNSVDQIELSEPDRTQNVSESENQKIRGSENQIDSDALKKTDYTDIPINRVPSESNPKTSGSHPNILNLFAYTGIASLAAAAAGAKVTHVDASYPAIGFAKENQLASGLSDKPIRWIEDDCTKFVIREIKRGTKYDGIIMDPPAFGHGPDGTMWKFNYHFPKLLELCSQVLSDNPLFVIVNAYAISSSSAMLKNVLEDYLGDMGGKIEYGELALEEKSNIRTLSTGIFATWGKS